MPPNSAMSPTLIPLSVTILAEARELLSALRRNRRFGYLLPFAASTQPAEHPLVKELKALRDVIRVPVATTSPTNTTSVSPQSLLIPADALLNALEPFFEVVRSRDASGIITGVALQSLYRISARLIRLSADANLMPQYATILSAIIEAAAACRFDATDPAADEVVLARITRVVSVVCTSEAAALLSDSSVLRAVEACLAIASGRRRASDLLKRTADVALADIFDTFASKISSILDAHRPVDPATKFASAFVPGVTGSAFGYSLDCDAFSQHGPASLAILVALLQLSSRMADPFYAQSASERALGLQLVSTFISSAGSSLRSHAALKRIVLRDCARGVLRSLGLFKSHPSVLAYAFTISINMVHALQEDVAPFLLALLERVFPYYISGFENVMPKVAGAVDSPGASDAIANPTPNGQASAGSSPTSAADPSLVEIDPVIREIGLEALADLLSIPGLLCVVYRLADCDMSRADVVEPLLKALGYAAKLNAFRRRSKRLRASTSGTNRVSGPPNVESDDEDAALQNAKGAPELSRYGRSAALLCADAILAVIDTISDRLKLETAGLVAPPHMDDSALEKSRMLRKDKVRLQSAAVAFNASDKVGKASKLLILLRELGLVSSTNAGDGTVNEDLEDDVRAIVRFIRETPELSKEKIGSILGEPDNLSRRVLADYSATFDFEARPFTESLRVYLESFRLPGEAQKIDRIVQSFANRYFEQNKPVDDHRKPVSVPVVDSDVSTRASDGVVENPAQGASPPIDTNDTVDDIDESHNISVLKNADAAYVLSFSVVMLNTDQHNESIRKKMTLEDFVRNCRGINDGEDLPKWFLSQVFDSIAAVEIRMSDEAGVGALTDLLWDEQLRKVGDFETQFPSYSESRVFDEQVFLLSWEAGVVAANSILNEAGEPNVVQKALEGFLSVSRCATTYKISRPTDAVVSSLCTATTIRDGPLHGAIVRFGTDIKAQMASVALSGVSRECGDWLRADGWQALVTYLLRLHALCLLPAELEQRIGGFGSELVGIDKQTISATNLVPAWWPSTTDRTEAIPEVVKPKKAQRPNGFFAAILAVSIGSEMESEDEDEDDGTEGVDGVRRRRVSHTPPFYVRTRNREDTEARDLARKCIAGCRIEDVVINEAKVLQSTSLEFLCKAIAQSAIRLMRTSEKYDAVENGNTDAEEGAVATEDSVLEWMDIAPSSPMNESSIIAGINSRRGIGAVTESDTDFSSFGLTQTWEGVTRDRDERKAREFVVAFCVDILCELTLQNRDRLHIPWPELHGLLVEIIAPATQSSAVLERAVVALLRVGVRLLHREELRDDVLRGFNLLVRLPPDIAEALSVPVAAGVFNIVKGHGSIIQSTSGWHAILSILESLPRYHVQAREIGLATITLILNEVTSSVAVSPKTYAPLLDAILAYTSCSSVDVSIQSLEMLYLLSQRLVMFNQSWADMGNVGGVRLSEQDMWSEYWSPLFLGFASSVRDARGKVRNCALGVMERVIASGGTTELLTAGQWQKVLTSVILPLMTQLFSSHGYLAETLEAEREAQRKIFEERNASIVGGGRGGRMRGRSFSVSAEHDEQLARSVAAACSKTRMRAVVVTSKTFLQHHMVIAAGLTEDAFTELWMSVLEVFRSAANTGRDDGEQRAVEVDDVSEHVPESVKNLLLVMCDCGLLKKEQHVRWNATFTLVRQFVTDIEDVISAATQNGGAAEESVTVSNAEEGRVTEASEDEKPQDDDGVRENGGTGDETNDVERAQSTSSIEVSS